VLRPEPGVLDADQARTAHPAHGPGQAGAVAEVHVHVVRLGRAGQEWCSSDDQGVHLRGDGVQHAVAERAGRERAAGPLEAPGRRRGQAGDPVPQEALADAPGLEGVELEREGVVGVLVAFGEGDQEALAQERLGGVREELDDVVERHVSDRRRGERAGEQRRRVATLTLRGERAAVGEGVVAEGSGGAGGRRRRGAGDARRRGDSGVGRRGW